MHNVASLTGELKSQGAEEAARDPNSSVTPQDAEDKIVDETKKAGGAVFRFNPNASPEEKAATAAAVSWTAWLSFGILIVISRVFLTVSITRTGLKA